MYKYLMCILLFGTTLSNAMMPLSDRDEKLIKTGQLLQASIDRAESSVYKLIQEGADVHYQDKNGNSILLQAAKIAGVSTNALEWQSSHAVMRYLLDAKADPNTANKNLERPLFALVHRAYTARSNKMLPQLIEAVRILIQHNAKIDAQDAYGSFAFQMLGDIPDCDELRNLLKPKI